MMFYRSRPSPFEPGKPVKPENFQGRVKLIKIFSLFINQAKFGNQEHFFINGRRGMGKSSFADYLLNIARTEYGMIGVHVYNDGIGNLNDFVNNVVEEILIQIKNKSWSQRIFDSLKDHIETVGLFEANIKFKPRDMGVTENFKDNFSHFIVDIIVFYHKIMSKI